MGDVVPTGHGRYVWSGWFRGACGHTWRNPPIEPLDSEGDAVLAWCAVCQRWTEPRKEREHDRSGM